MYNNMMYSPYNYGNQYMPGGNNQVQNNNMVNTGVKPTFTGSVVNSFAEVREFPVPLDGSVLLIHESEKKMYIKKLSNTGVPTISTFRYEECVGDTGNSDDSNNYSSLEKRILDLENRLKQMNSVKSTPTLTDTKTNSSVTIV